MNLFTREFKFVDLPQLDALKLSFFIIIQSDFWQIKSFLMKEKNAGQVLKLNSPTYPQTKKYKEIMQQTVELLKLKSRQSKIFPELIK